MSGPQGAPRRALGALDVVAIIIGLVVGAGIFKSPAVVAANTGSDGLLLIAWVLGGIISLLGALCYAELASTYPDTGGEYHFLSRAYGQRLGFLFAWSRLVVLQTGSIALLGFVAGDYLCELLPAGPHGPTLYALFTVVALTAVNIRGQMLTRWTQHLLVVVTLAGLVLVIAAGLWLGAAGATTAMVRPAPGASGFGVAMVFVLFTYGGWNEAAYVSAELKRVERNMARVLVGGIGAVVLLYLLVNLGYLRVLGIDRMSGSEVVTADFMRLLFGETGAKLVSGLIVLAVLASMNVTILTGARTNYALAKDSRLLRRLAYWDDRANAPIRALLAQGAVAVGLVIAGSFGRSGFEAMVSYVSPVFWFFFLMTALALPALRIRDPGRHRPFRVPAYPFTPIVFACACGYMLYASLAYSGAGALYGLALLGAGVALLWLRPHGSERMGRRS